MAYHRASLSTYTASITIIMTVGTVFDVVSFFAWLVFILLAAPLNISSFRKEYFSKPMLSVFRKKMPEISITEKQAIDAGTTWFEAELFRGSPNWQKLHNFPKPRLSAQEQAFLAGPVEQVCSMINDWETTHKQADLSPEVWQFLKDNKFFAMIIEEQYGGLAFSAYAQSRVLQKLSSVSTVLASTVGVPNSLGPGELIQHYGSQAQKHYYLPRLATGLEIPCFALTNPEAGSDASAIPDFGTVCYGQFDGKKVLGMQLTWHKRYITLAPIATVLGLAFKLYDPENLLGKGQSLGITCALIPTHIEGVDIGRRHLPLNVPFQNGPTKGTKVFVPLDYIIGGQEMAGKGWQMLMECLSVGRSITLPANSTGGVKSTALATGAYARIRRQFKQPIGKLEGIEQPLARIGGNAYLMDAVTTLSTGAIDLGEKPAVISAIIKYHLTEKMRACMNDAMDIHGGKGICLGPSNYLAKGYQGAPIAITVEGANILTRNMIIFGQGAIRCHPYLLAELQAAQNKDHHQALDDFDHALFGHIGFTISNIMRGFWLSLTGAKFVGAPYRDVTKGYYQTLTRFSASLAMLADISMLVLGSHLKRKERISARLGDMLSHLYLASATLKRFNDEGRQTEDIPLMQWAVESSLFDIQQAMDELMVNFPNKWLSYLLRALTLPFGKQLTKPSDSLDSQVAIILQTPSATRDRLGQGQFLTNTANNPLGQLEQTLRDILAAEPIFEKLCKSINEKLPFYQLDLAANRGLAVNAITKEEAELLFRAERGRQAAINVDDFDPLALSTEVNLAKNTKDNNQQESHV